MGEAGDGGAMSDPRKNTSAIPKSLSLIVKLRMVPYAL